MMKLYIDLDRKSETLLKQQLAKEVNDAQTQSLISIPISGQSGVHNCYSDPGIAVLF